MNFFNKFKTCFVTFLSTTLNKFHMRIVIKIILILSPLYLWAEYPYNSILDIFSKHGNDYQCSAIIIGERYIIIPGYCIDVSNKEEFIIKNSKYPNIKLTDLYIVKNTISLLPVYFVFKVAFKFDVGDIISFNGPVDPYSKSKITNVDDLHIRDKSFSWGKIKDKYFILGVKLLNGEYYATTDHYQSIFHFMINKLDLGDGENNLAGINFSTIPTVTKQVADAYIKDLIHKEWFETSNGAITTIPFKANKEKEYCCGGKYILVRIYNNTFKPNISFAKLELYCKRKQNCIHVLGHDYWDHVVLTYRDSETGKVMIIDPAIDDSSFELNNLELLIYLNKAFTVNDIVYVVSKDNFTYNSFFPLINEVETPDNYFRNIYSWIRQNDNFK